MTYKVLDVGSWSRKEHFAFFSKFHEPFFGITVNVDVTAAFSYCKTNGFRFFDYYLHKTLIAANSIENFRYRIESEQVVVFDRVDASPTIMRDDETFGFGFVEFNPDYNVFSQALTLEMQRVKSTPGLFTRNFPQNLLHISALPWLDFTAISHARQFGNGDSCPKISFGRLSPGPDETLVLPMSVHVHHALMDGLQVSRFVERFREEMSNC